MANTCGKGGAVEVDECVLALVYLRRQENFRCHGKAHSGLLRRGVPEPCAPHDFISHKVLMKRF